MADNPDGKSAAEPTMEEILASIRKIIADEKDPNAPDEEKPPSEDVLELTQMVQEDGSVVDLAASPTPVQEPAVPPPPPKDISSEPVVEAAPVAKPTLKEGLVSEKAATSASSSLASLASTVQIERMAAGVPAMTPLGNGSRTLEDMVMELIKPMMKDWLDQNLPAIVEKLVQKEIERIAHRVQD